MKLILDNFRAMTGGHMPGIQTDKADLRYRFIQGFVPHYFELASEASDANFKKKVSPPYSLVLSPGLTSIQSKSGKYPTVMIANESDSLGKVIYSTDLWEFFIDDATETSLGIPNGTPTTNVGIDAVVFNGRILTSHPLNANLYHGAINATPSWTATTATSLATGVTRILKPIEDRCLVTDSSGGSFTRNDAVRIVLPDFSIIAGITLGDTFHIQDIANFDDRYALLFAQKTASPRLTQYTHVFMWNRVPGDSYDKKITLKGAYKCSIEKDGVVYAFTQVGSTLICYYFDGVSFREAGRIKNIVVSSDLNIPKTRIGVEGDFFVLLASSSGNTTSRSPFYWNPFSGESFFLLKAVAELPYRSLLIAQDATTAPFGYKRYFSYQNTGGVGFVFQVTMENATKTDIGANLGSNFIPAPRVKGIHDDMPMGRMLIKSVTIDYSTPPPSANDIIAFTLTNKDEYEADTYGTQTASVKNTTVNSTNAKVGATRAILSVGAKATEFAIDLSVTVSTTSWDLVIRRIVIDYEPIALQP